jgi:hypothetical protein
MGACVPGSTGLSHGNLENLTIAAPAATGPEDFEREGSRARSGVETRARRLEDPRFGGVGGVMPPTVMSTSADQLLLTQDDPVSPPVTGDVRSAWGR